MTSLFLCDTILLRYLLYAGDENGKLILTDGFKDYVKKYDGILYGHLRADHWSNRDYAYGGIQAHKREKAYNLAQKFVIGTSSEGILRKEILELV